MRMDINIWGHMVLCERISIWGDMVLYERILFRVVLEVGIEYSLNKRSLCDHIKSWDCEEIWFQY